MPTASSPPPAEEGADGACRGCAPLSLEELVLAHHGAIYRYAYRLSGSQADAEDLTQQTFLVAQQKLDQVRDPQRAAGWLFAIARTCFLKSRAKHWPRGGDVEVDEVPAPSPEVRDVDSEALQQGLGELPEEQRLVLIMFYFEELSYKEIAQQLETPLGTVMSRISRGKQRLRERLAARNSNDEPSPRSASPTLRPAPARMTS